MKILFLAIPFALLYSCNRNIENKQDGIPQTLSDTLQTTDTAFTGNILFKDIPVKQFPVIDSTNFDNFSNSSKIVSDVFEKLNMQQTFKEAENFRANYLLPFSDKFTSVVITYKKGEFELFTTLVTVNNDNKIIDTLTIAYDEIAESSFRTTSTLNKSNIIIDDWNYMGEETVKESKKYILGSDGKFKEVKK
ncbi:hypothetical protein QW060_07460 [Myroides ceti]|uniref:Uncharacterized protein n=1 Tax=Paenimyroides ceti TaxID=395087 RepID=A0ABT8CRH6_9FLAO|nr:hypothetical protein [Paenimyroides ceti]MDN3706970.1 hypothetical protein [Paenimyroides ceti]